MSIKKDWAAKVVKREKVANKTYELTVSKPEGFKYEVGQYVNFKFPEPYFETEDNMMRPLSIASHPEEDVLKFVVRESESDFKKMYKEIKTGDPVSLFGPLGNFIPVEIPKDQNIALLISGIGIAPVLPFFKKLKDEKHEGKIKLFYSNRTPDIVTYDKELENYPLGDNYEYIKVLTGVQKRIDGDFIEAHVGDLNNYVYYIVGTKDFIKSMRTALKGKGVDNKKVKIDNFG